MIRLLICKEKKQALISPKSPVGEKTSIPRKKDGIRDIWKKEIDLEYEYYLAALRAHRDLRYLIEERDGLISKFESAQIRNVELRKDIRALERELYTMCHKNAHNSCVIDGLQEIDEQVKQTQHFEADLKHKLSLAEKERSNCEEIMSLLQHEIELLSNKNGVDAKLVDSLKPHTERLKDMLDSKKLENHQNAQEFKRELQALLEKGKEKNSEFEALMQESAVKSSWLEEIFLSIGDGRTQKNLPLENKEEESEK
ncbi:hypothetical protein AVEN_51509-1 [Araneus ventricosus]|uniref:Uncharacterized protein n=1 Tax=Araneus ventricosus TaxID=182803 RepID=A0A4Y2GJ73_ARAVE|nr:hypothetical protein AVEN_51509-1 [Araneus ventricosus]